MHKEEQLLNKFPGLDLTANLQQGSSAAAVSAVLGDKHTNASAAAAAVATMGGTLSATAATEAAAHRTSNAAAEVPSVVSTAAREEAVSALASAVLESADPTLAGLSRLLTQLAKQAGSALQHLVSERGAGSTQQQQHGEEGGLSPAALLAQVQALQQQLPGQHDVAGLLADYQAWLEQLRGRMLKQHEHTQVRAGTKHHRHFKSPQHGQRAGATRLLLQCMKWRSKTCGSMLLPLAALSPAGTPVEPSNPAPCDQKRPAAV